MYYTHSLLIYSAEGVYIFTENRDVKYLLDLCVKLKLFVLCAPGPYICAETSAGGFPHWLLAKRDINIRHTKRLLFRSFDSRFTYYSLQWWEQILTIIKPFQITENKLGCVIGLQIENEYFEYLSHLPVGLHDEMKILCKYARKFGITVPFFTNDMYECGSFIPGNKKGTFGVDLYGFDKYVIFAPVSSPTAAVLGSEKFKEKTMWKEWNPSDFTKAVDNIEKTVRSFDGDSRNVIPTHTLTNSHQSSSPNYKVDGSITTP
jgi:hypothetical protein